MDRRTEWSRKEEKSYLLTKSTYLGGYGLVVSCVLQAQPFLGNTWD